MVTTNRGADRLPSKTGREITLDQWTSLATSEAAAQITRANVDGWQTWNGALGQPATVVYGYIDLGGSWQEFNADEIFATEAVLGLWSDLANITFVQLT